MLDINQLLTPQEAAEALNISITTLYTYRKQKKIRGVKSGRRRYYHPSEIDRFLALPSDETP